MTHNKTDTEKALEAVERARAELARAEAALRDIRARRMILCGCGATHAIGELRLRVQYWYEGPHGCTGGDQWHEGEWQFVCPVDGVVERLLFDDCGVEYFNRRKIGIAAEPTFKHLYVGLFASRVEVRQHRSGAEPWRNNYYVDRHRDYFELPARSGGCDGR